MTGNKRFHGVFHTYSINEGYVTVSEKELERVISETKELEANHARMVKFIMSKGYTLKDYIAWLKEEVWK